MENKKEIEQILDFIQVCMKYWYYFAISLGICGIIGLTYYSIATPIMKVSSQVMLRHDESPMGGASISKTQSLVGSMFGIRTGSENIEDETMKMASEGYFRSMVKKLELNKVYTRKQYLGFVTKQLYDKSPIILSTDTMMADTLSAVIVFTLKVQSDKMQIKAKVRRKTIGKFEVSAFPATIETQWGRFTFEKTPYYKLSDCPQTIKVLYSNYDYMAQVYQKKVVIDFQKKTSDLINLEFKNANVVFAKNILNALINIYNEEWVNDKITVSEKTIDFINERLASTEVLLGDADTQIKQFKNKYNLTDINVDVTYYFKLTAELQAKLLEAETQLKVADIIVDFVRDEKNKYALIPFNVASSSEKIAEIIGKYNEELMKRNELYKSNAQSVMVRSLDEYLEKQRENLLISVENIKKGLQIARDDAQQKEQEFNLKIGNIPTIEKDFVQLKREQELQQNIYVFLLEMKEQISVRGIDLLPKLKTINDPYALNKPVSPSLIKTSFFVLFFGIVIPLFLIFGIPYFKLLRKEKVS